MNRRLFALGTGASIVAGTQSLRAQTLQPLDVAYAGSMGSMMEGPIKAGVASALRIDMRGRALGSDALAKLIVGGSLSPDVFVPVTPAPMRAVLEAGKAQTAVPIARTEMVLAFSPKSKYAGALADAAAGKKHAMPWWQILEQADIRFGRTDPTVDPQGRNIIFTLQLAETYYARPGLARKILGETINPAQIFDEPTVQARLQSGELDVASAYKIQPGPFDLPYLSLPHEIDLGDASMRDRYAATSLVLGERTYRPEPLVYYAAVLAASARRTAARAFVDFLAGADGEKILASFAYDAPTGATPLHA